jgi:phage terminase small subunit
MAENESLTPKQYKLLSFLLAPMSITEAAKEAGIAESTAYRWLNDPAFKQVLESSKSNLFEQGMSALQAKFVNAVQALERNLNAEQATAQIRAAQVIIEQTIANQHLVERITELEALMQSQEQERMYHHAFDLRQLTREERDQLEAIEEARLKRQGTTIE